MWDRLGMSDGNFFFQILLEFFNVLQVESAFYFCMKVNFFLHFCYYFENDNDVRKSSNNLLKTSKYFSWLLDIKMVFKIITNDKRKNQLSKKTIVRGQETVLS